MSWKERDAKKLPIEGFSLGQNAVLGVVDHDAPYFKRPKTALRGVTNKAHARAVKRGRRLGKARRSRRRQLRKASRV